MKLTLRYDTDEYTQTAYNPSAVGSELSAGDKIVTIDPIIGQARDGSEEVTGYEVAVQVKCLDLTSGFLNNTHYYFALINDDYAGSYDYEGIQLGDREYTIRHDGLPDRNDIVYHIVTIKFIIDTDEYDDYTTLDEWYANIS